MMTGAQAAAIASAHKGLAYKWNGDFDGPADLVTYENVRAWLAADPVHFSEQKARWLIEGFLNQMAGDCSGLITHTLGMPKTYSGTLFRSLTGVVKFDQARPLRGQIPAKPGIIVWREGHIGMYRGDGTVVESGSTRLGVTIQAIDNPVTGVPWTHYGYLTSQIEYGGTIMAYTTLREGNSGDLVKALQTKLEALGYELGAIDGAFGGKTDTAVRAFQADHGLTVDGIAGPQTQAALDAAIIAKNTQAPAVDYKPALDAANIQIDQLEAETVQQRERIASLAGELSRARADQIGAQGQADKYLKDLQTIAIAEDTRNNIIGQY